MTNIEVVAENEPRPHANVPAGEAGDVSALDSPSAASGVEEGKPAEAQSKPKNARLTYLKAGLRLAGVGGTLIAVGYIAEAGHDELLSVNFPINRTLTDYSFAGGRFFIDVIIKCWSHPWIALSGLIAIGASAAIVTAIRRLWPDRHWAINGLGLLWVVAILLWKGYRLDFPYIQLDGILKRMPLDESVTQPALGSWRGFKEAALRDKFVCTHIEGERDEISRALASRFPQCSAIIMRTETISPETALDLLVPSAPHESFSIEQEFIINVFVAAYLLVVMFATPATGSTSDDSPNSEWSGAIRTVSMVVAAASIVTLPFIYGKVIRSMESPAGRIAFDSVDATSTPPMKPTIAFADGLLIWTDDKFVTIYRSDTFEFLHLSRDRVRYIAVDRTKDIIRIYAKAYCPVKTPATRQKQRRT